MSYVSLHKKELLDVIENQVLYADLLTILTAPKGMGKSYFASLLLSRLKGQVYLSQIEADAVMSKEQLEKSISLQLGLSWQSSDQTLLNKIEQVLEQRALLIIDDAHLLTRNCLEYLSELALQQQTDAETRLFILLLGEPVLEKKLYDVPLLKARPELCVVFELRPIEDDETRHLLAELQSLSLANVESIYGEQKINYFWKLSKGVPGELVRQLKRWEEETSVKPKTQQTKKPIQHYLRATAYFLFTMVLVLMLVYQDELNEIITPSNAEQQQAGIEEKSEKDGENVPQIMPELDKEVVPETDELEVTDTETIDTEMTETEAAYIEVKLPEATESEFPGTKKPEVKTELEQKSDSSISALGSQSAVDQIDLSKADGKPESDRQASVETLEAVSQKIEAKNLADESGQVSGFEFSEDEAVLIEFPEEGYLLQWTGLSSLASANRFRSKHPLGNSMRVYRRTHEKGYLFMVVSGQFISFKAAKEALSEYKDKKYRGNPWIKPTKDVKKDIKALISGAN